MTDSAKSQTALMRTGIEGLDHILQGGLLMHRMYLIEGDPGAGKTTLAMQYLITGAQCGERCLFVTLSESEDELRASAQTHGMLLDGIKILEVIASEESLVPDARYTMYHPSEVEMGQTIRTVLEEVNSYKPTRLVFDSLSELRLLAQNALRYRRQILALKHFFSRKQCTVLFIDDKTGDIGDTHLHSIAHGVISLERISPEFGTIRRRLQIIKMRGSDFRAGFHDYSIRPGGVVVFPRLIAAEHYERHSSEQISAGIPALDALLGGGLGRGTSTLILGPAGTGKSSVACQYAVTAAARGERSALFVFDERHETYLERSSALNMDVEGLTGRGLIQLRQIDPAEMSPGEFAYAVRIAVERDDCRIVVIDSLNGFMNAMPSERHLTLQLHELLTYLGHKGVTTILLMAQHGLVGENVQVPVDASYLADTVIQMRYYEAMGEVRQAISVIKKRSGHHERTIRELRIESGKGIVIGQPIREFHGVLTGVPTYVGNGHGAGNSGQTQPGSPQPGSPQSGSPLLESPQPGKGKP